MKINEKILDSHHEIKSIKQACLYNCWMYTGVKNCWELLLVDELVSSKKASECLDSQ